MFRIAAVAAGWYALGVIGLLLNSDASATGSARSIFVLSGTALLFGLWVFWRHGGVAVTATGIYNFAFALFVGVAGLYLLYVGTGAVYSGATNGSLVRALAWCYFGHVSAWLLFWTADHGEPSPAPSGRAPINPAFLRRVAWAGVFVAGVGAVASLEFVGSLRVLGQATGFVGAVLVAIGLLSDERRPPLLGCLLAAGGLLLSMITSNSFGRLMLASLGFALLVVISRRLRTRLVKTAVIVGAPLMLLIFANMRTDAVRASLPGAQITGTGLESVASPLQVLGVLLDYNNLGILVPVWGHTFWAAVISLVPRAVWPTKPIGFGADLTLLLRPDLQDAVSYAALIQGEWLWNFGLMGLVLVVPAVGFAVRAVDGLLTKAAARPLVTRRALFWYVAAIVVAVSLPELAWGTSTFVARAGMRLAVFTLAWLLISDRRDQEPGRT